MGKIGRNARCPCGSGKKYKKCHGSNVNPSPDIFANHGPFEGNPLKQTLQTFMSGNLPQKDNGKILAKITAEKREATRPLPSSKLISIGTTPMLAERIFLVDASARLVDQNWCGRSEMCVFFAVLLRHGLNLLGYQATVEIGRARYLKGDKDFEWDHAWVRTSTGDIVDGNVDSLVENPMVPEGIEPRPYWGPSDKMPQDREFQKVRVLLPERDAIELGNEIIRWQADLEKEIGKAFYNRET